MSQDRIKFNFEYDHDYRVIATNGVWGGITPRADIKIDFFVESRSTPAQVEHEIKDGRLGEPIEFERTFTRTMQVGVLLSLEHAESLKEFLQMKIDELKKIRDPQQP